MIIPELQRGYVWDNGRASKLIESLILNIPIPVVYFAERDDAKWEVIDGHQRIRSVVRYLNNEFSLISLEVLGDLKQKRFHELPEREQRYLKTRTIRAVVLAPESHPKMKFQIFERLNSGSLSLNAQELRHALYPGPFNDLLQALSRDQSFRSLIGTKNPRHRMVDEELVLRFLALHQRLSSYRPPLKQFLTDFMRDFKDADLRLIDEFVGAFSLSISRAQELLGKSAFRLADREGRPTESIVLRALFDAQMLVLSWIATDELALHQQKIIANLGSLYEDEQFSESLRRATGDRTIVDPKVKTAKWVCLR